MMDLRGDLVSVLTVKRLPDVGVNKALPRGFNADPVVEGYRDESGERRSE